MAGYMDKVKSWFGGAKKQAGVVVDKAGEKVPDKVKETYGKVSDKVESIIPGGSKGDAGDKADDAKDAADTAADKVEGAADAAKDEAASAADKIDDAADTAVDKAKDAAGN